MTACNLIVNYLPPDANEQEISDLFKEYGTVKGVKVIRNKVTGASLCYGFVVMAAEEMAEAAILGLSQKPLRGKVLRVSKAKPQEDMQREEDNSNVYIVGVSPIVDDAMLQATFSKYGPIVSSHIIKNKNEGQKGVAFVKYMNSEDAARAIEQQNQQVMCIRNCSDECECREVITVKYALRSKKLKTMAPYTGPMMSPAQGGLAVPMATNMGFPAPVTVPPSTLPNYGYATGHLQTFISPSSVNSYFNPIQAQMLTGGYQYPYMMYPNVVNGMYPPIPFPMTAPVPISTESLAIGRHCLFVYGLSQATTEEEVQALFLPYGAISNLRLAYDVTEGKRSCKGYGFVNFYSFDDAQNAITALNNHSYKGRLLQVRFKSNKDSSAT